MRETGWNWKTVPRGRCFVLTIIGVILSQMMGEALYYLHTYNTDMIICFIIIMGGYAHFVKDNCCDN